MIKSDAIKKPSDFLQNFLMSLCILLLPFGDTVLGEGSLGVFGAYASSFPIIILLFSALVVSKNKKLLWCIFCIATVHYFFSMGLYEHYSGYPNASFVEATWKSIKIGILFSTVLVFFFVKIDYFYLKLCLIIAFMLSLIGLVIPENDVSFLHATENFNMRPRGFSQESSHLAQSLGAIGLLLAALCKRKIFGIIVLGVTAFCISFIKSKAGIVLFCVALNVMACHYLILNRSCLKNLVSGFIAFFVTLAISYFSIVSSVSFLNEVEKISSNVVSFFDQTDQKSSLEIKDYEEEDLIEFDSELVFKDNDVDSTASFNIDRDPEVQMNSDQNTKNQIQSNENEKNSVLSRINNDIEKYTSSATRLAGGVNAVVNADRYPLGVGFYGYNGAIVDAVPESIKIIAHYFKGFNFSEINSYKKLDSGSVSTKSFFFDLIVLFGVFGFIISLLVLLLIKENIRVLKKPLLFGSLLYSIAALMIWSTGIGIYSLFLVFNVIINREDEYE